MRRQAAEHKGVAMSAHCQSHPEDGTHECLRTEMRCAYCGTRLDPYPCHGCGKFLTAEEMSIYGGGVRCRECE